MFDGDDDGETKSNGPPNESNITSLSKESKKDKAAFDANASKSSVEDITLVPLTDAQNSPKISPKSKRKPSLKKNVKNNEKVENRRFLSVNFT